MRCAKCGAENREGRKFCAKCGSSLARRCPQCSASNDPGEDFCGECGGALAGNAQAVSPKAPPVTAPAPEIRVTAELPETSMAIDGERKTVTALFADIKGSMELIEDLDPEEARRAGRSRAQADDGRGASLRGLCGAIDRGWHLRAVRSAGRARRPSAAGAARVAQDAGGHQAVRKQAARGGARADRDSRRG